MPPQKQQKSTLQLKSAGDGSRPQGNPRRLLAAIFFTRQRHENGTAWKAAPFPAAALRGRCRQLHPPGTGTMVHTGRQLCSKITGSDIWYYSVFLIFIHYTGALYQFQYPFASFWLQPDFYLLQPKVVLKQKKPAEAGRQKRAEAEKVQNSPGFFLLFFKLNRSPAGQKRIELQHCSEHAIIIKAECIRILSQPDIERD